jgi:hypothetical protein
MIPTRCCSADPRAFPIPGLPHGFLFTFRARDQPSSTWARFSRLDILGLAGQIGTCQTLERK